MIDLDTEHKPYSLAVREGRINIPKCQYDQMPNPVKACYIPVIVGSGVLMFRWKDAPPLIPKLKQTGDEEYDSFKALVVTIMGSIGNHIVNLIEGDEDEEYMYGAFLTAINSFPHMSEADWLLTKVSGGLYELRKITPEYLSEVQNT